MTDDPAQEEPLVLAGEAFPLNKFDATLQECFAKDMAAQATRLDELAKQIITLNIAIPGIYVAVLKLSSSCVIALGDSRLILVAVAFWLLALVLALASLFPQKREVDPEDLNEIQHYFSDSARNKRVLLSVASISSFVGIGLVLYQL